MPIVRLLGPEGNAGILHVRVSGWSCIGQVPCRLTLESCLSVRVYPLNLIIKSQTLKP